MTDRPEASLSAEFVRSILDYDPQTGIFRWRHRADRSKRWNTRYAGQVAGSFNNGYIQIMIGKGLNFRAHRLAWLHYYGAFPTKELDHRHGNRSDNRISELREADDAQNATNKAMQCNNTSGVVGVHFDQQSQRWFAVVNKDGQRVFRARFRTKEAAEIARKAAVLRIHGEFARHR